MSEPAHYRILVVDDNPAIHEDFRKILLGHQNRNAALDAAEAILFDNAPGDNSHLASFSIDSAHQGREALEKVKEAMAGLLDPIIKEVIVGAADVKKVFELSKGGSVAGCAVSHGRILKGKVRIMRRKGLVYEGQIQSLRRFQDEVNEVRAGMECGIRIDGFNEFQPGDVIEAYTLEKLTAKL